jgi:peptidoglycan/LPS O-acetylase OafA/YrhL
VRELREPGLAVDIESAERSRNLDILRAIAALSIVATHAYGLGIQPGETQTDLGFAQRSLIGSSGVWLFFALSGYLITGPFIRSLMTGGSLPDLLDYGTRRLARIFPAYLVAFAAVILWGLPRNIPIDWWEYPVHTVLLHNLVPGQEQAMYNASWTLTIELLFYAAVPMVALLVRRFHRQPVSPHALVAGVVAIWLVSISWTFVAGGIEGYPKGALWLRFLLPSMLSMFCPGILAAIAVVRWREQGRPPRWFELVCTHRRLALLSVVACCALGVLGIFQLLDTQVYDLSRQAFAVGFGIVVMLALTRPDVSGVLGRVFGFLGLISYGIYLWHAAIRQIIYRHGIEGWVPMPRMGAVTFVVHLLYLLALTLPVAWLSWVLVERPAIRWAKRTVDRRQADAALAGAGATPAPAATPLTGARD